MQNTRLNGLLGAIALQWRRWFLNPWRRLSLLVITLLFGFFLGAAISLSAGQRGISDILAAGLVVLFTELVDRIYYSRSQRLERALWVETLNALKVGVTYSLFVDAFKLGS
jgi:hypothetical protein